MKIIKTLFLFLGLFWTSVYSQSDFGIGKWRLHSVFGAVKNVIKADNRIYAQSDRGLYYYDLNEQSLIELSKVDGLSSNEFSALAFDESTKTLIIGYSDGNIDLVQDNQIININSIKESTLSGSKLINHIQSSKGKAYLSTDFGMVVLNLNKLEVAETYRGLGTNGVNVSITYSELSNSDSLYILTNEGIKVGDASGRYNLLDGGNWTNINFGVGEISSFHLFNSELFAVISDNKIYKYSVSEVTRINAPVATINSLISTKDKLYISYSNALYSYENDMTSLISTGNDVQDWTDVISNADILWSGNKDGAIIKYELNTQTSSSYKISGLSSNIIWRGSFTNGKLFVTGGGYDNYQTLNRETIIHKFDNKWLTKIQNKKSEGVYNAMDIVYNEVQGKYYICSFLGGLLEWDGVNDFKKIPDADVPFHSALDFTTWIKLFNLEMHNGEMWVTNHETRNLTSIHKMNRQGEWSSYKLNSVHGSFPEDIKVDVNGNLWISIGSTGAKSGMVFYNPNTGQERYLINQLNSGGLPHWKVNDYAIDKDNNVWVATGQGVASFQNTSTIFNNSPYNAVKPIVNGRPVLQDEEVTSVAVDGGNRKWFGTNNGVFLFDDDGEKPLLNFNVNNSPLPSNILKDIVINDKTGEIFFITAEGIASYWGDATESTEKFDNVEVFPNPILPNFDGMVSIRGLSTDALVKITDIGGRLVYEANSEGGQMVWNGLDINGNKVKTGIYLIFSSSTDGEEQFAGKFAVVE